MFATVNLYSTKKGELNDFLSRFYNTDLEIYNNLNWEKKYTPDSKLFSKKNKISDCKSVAYLQYTIGSQLAHHRTYATRNP